jgi:anti-anti-sigma factor
MAGTTTLRPVGDLDIARADRLRAEWFPLVDEQQPELVIVDLADVTFLDVAGLRVIAGLIERQRAREGTVAVANASARVLYPLRVTSLSDLLDSMEPAAEA